MYVAKVTNIKMFNKILVFLFTSVEIVLMLYIPFLILIIGDFFFFSWPVCLEVYQHYGSSQRTMLWFQRFLCLFSFLFHWFLLQLFFFSYPGLKFLYLYFLKAKQMIYLKPFWYRQSYMLLSTTLSASHKFWYLCFHLHLIQYTL